MRWGVLVEGLSGVPIGNTCRYLYYQAQIQNGSVAAMQTLYE